MFLDQNPSNEADNQQRSYTPKIFCLMTLTITLALQMVDFGKNEALIVSF